VLQPVDPNRPLRLVVATVVVGLMLGMSAAMAVLAWVVWLLVLVLNNLFFAPSIPLELTALDVMEIEITEQDFKEAEAVTRDDPAVWDPELEAPPPPSLRPEPPPARLARKLATIESVKSMGLIAILGTRGDDSMSDVLSAGVLSDMSSLDSALMGSGDLDGAFASGGLATVVGHGGLGTGGGGRGGAVGLGGGADIGEVSSGLGGLGTRGRPSDRRAKVVRRAKLELPEDGHCTVMVTVAVDGTPKTVQVRTCDVPSAQARDAALASTYRAALEDGEPVQGTVRVTFR
jgi:hypothetical protein